MSLGIAVSFVGVILIIVGSDKELSLSGDHFNRRNLFIGSASLLRLLHCVF